MCIRFWRKEICRTFRGTSRVLIVASLQRLKLKALIPAPADCEVRSVLKFLNAQSIAPIGIHRQLCQANDHTRWTHLLQELGWEVFNHHPRYKPTPRASRNSCPVSVSVFRMTERWGWVSHSTMVSIPGYKSWSRGMTNVPILKANMLKNSSTLAVSVPINVSVKLGLFL